MGIQAIDGIARWGVPTSFTEIVQTSKIDTDSLDANTNISIWTNTDTKPIEAGNGRFYVGSQFDGMDVVNTGGYAYTDDGSTWVYTAAKDLVDDTTIISGLSPQYVGITDLDEALGYLFLGTYYQYATVASYFDYTLGVRDKSNIYNHIPEHPSPIEFVSGSAPQYTNCRVSHSATHVALASIESTDTLHISMGPITPGVIGDLTPTFIPASFDLTGNNNLCIQAINDDLYLLGESGTIYQFDQGGTSLSSPVMTIGTDTEPDRHLTDLGYKYLIASSPENSVLYLPDSDITITLFDDSNRSADIQLLWDSGYTRVENHTVGSEKYIVSAFETLSSQFRVWSNCCSLT